MIKNLTFLAIAGLFVNAGCVINTNPIETDSGTNITTTNNTSTEGTTEGTTTNGTTDGTATDDTGTTSPTTTAPTTTDATSTTSDGTTDDTTDGTTGSGFGKCGWDADNKYYACGFVGADPDGISAIECPDPLPADGDPCDDMSAISGVGCCLPDGTNYYCSAQGMITIEACGS